MRSPRRTLICHESVEEVALMGNGSSCRQLSRGNEQGGIADAVGDVRRICLCGRLRMIGARHRDDDRCLCERHGTLYLLRLLTGDVVTIYAFDKHLSEPQSHDRRTKDTARRNLSALAGHKGRERCHRLDLLLTDILIDLLTTLDLCRFFLLQRLDDEIS